MTSARSSSHLFSWLFCDWANVILNIYVRLHPHTCTTAENSYCKLFKSGKVQIPFQARAAPVVLCFWPPRFIPRVPCACGGEIAHVLQHRVAVKRALSCQLTALIMKTASQFKDGSVYAGYRRQSRLSGYQWSFLPLCDSCTTLLGSKYTTIYNLRLCINTDGSKRVFDCDKIIHIHSHVPCQMPHLLPKADRFMGKLVSDYLYWIYEYFQVYYTKTQSGCGLLVSCFQNITNVVA